MPVLYIAANRPRAGKTTIASALARRFASDGRSVAVVKALSTAQGPDPDTETYQQLLGQPPNTRLPIYTSPAQLAQPLTNDVTRRVKEAVAALQRQHPLVIVEGLSSIDPQQQEAQASAQLAQALGARVLLVAAYRPELDLAALAPARDLFGQRLVSVVINGVTKYRERLVQQLISALRDAGIAVPGWLPEDRTLLGVSVGELARHLDGQFLSNEDKANSLVKHFLIGAIVLDSGTTYFERISDKAVLVRGNRPDIQMAALHTPTACLVLTGDADPIQYVQHEAAAEEVPLIKVPLSTLDAAARLDDLVAHASFNHPRKLERMETLISQHLDVTSLFTTLAG